MMDRAEYNSCIANGLRGKKLGKEERKLEFCIISKTCSGKARSREEAARVCSLPKPPKPEGTGKKRRSKKTAAAEFDTTTLIPRCEGKLAGMVRSGELPRDTDVPGICQLILG
jgi:hypothetical protein